MKKKQSRKQFWIDHIKKWQQSNLSQSHYCSLHGINVKSFSAQKSQLKIPTVKETESNFLPVKTNGPTSFSIELTSGEKISFDNVPNARWVAQLLSAISESHA